MGAVETTAAQTRAPEQSGKTGNIESVSTGTVCTLGTTLVANFADVRDQRFDCGPDRLSLVADRLWGRIDVPASLQNEGPLELQGDSLYLEGAQIHAVFADGSVKSTVFTEADLVAGARPRGRYALPVPQSSVPLRTVYAAVDMPFSITSVKLMRLNRVAEADAEHMPVMMMLGMLIGLAFIPLLYNAFFFIALRYRFLLWHSVTVCSTLAYIYSSSGAIFLMFGEFGTYPRFMFNYWSLAIGISAAAIFTLTFLEAKMLSRNMQRWLVVVALLPIFVTAIVLHTGDWSRLIGRGYYHASFIPALVLPFFAMAQAFRRGSRAVRYQMAAWIPVIILALERVGRGMDVYRGFEWMDYGLYFALILETMIVALGITDRIMILRRDHEKSVRRADQMAHLAETDGLTGLANRRGFDRVFAEAHAKGTFAELVLMDIDHFKHVNDECGHDSGDNVLRTIGSVLNDAGIVAARIGGEEFALLIQKGDAKIAFDLEALRTRITRMIKIGAPNIPTPVTVSMGVAPIIAEFAAQSIYALADRRLYVAKRAGRNCIERGGGTNETIIFAKEVA